MTNATKNITVMIYFCAVDEAQNADNATTLGI